MYTEADTCRKFITPKIVEAGWDNFPHSIAEQRTFTDGRVNVIEGTIYREKKKRADYILRYTKDFPIAVVEAKAYDETAGKGLQQAKDYAQILGLKFAYATNGKVIIEFDFTTGVEKIIENYPTPQELWERYKAAENISDEMEKTLLTPFERIIDKSPRYYQEIAINKTIESILKGQKRILLTMATGTGKTFTSFQICWKLWNSRWNAGGENRKPRILYLADRNVLIDDPKDKTFTSFGEARIKLENGEAIKSREIYFSTYQSLSDDISKDGLYREYPKDFFDLIIIDECHRGSASSDNTWRKILEYFESAYQLGLTATPLKDDNRDTYEYFGAPIYEYSLKQGIEDGFLAPYTVHRITTSVDKDGWVPQENQVDGNGVIIPQKNYTTDDFEKIVVNLERTRAIAKNLVEYMQNTHIFDKTIVFCVDQDHAELMRSEIAQLCPDILQAYPNFVCRVTSDEGTVGKGHLSNFQDLEKTTPGILTTSQLLTTGVDMPTVRNIVLARNINSISDFKQIIGRGTRVKEDYGKLFFNILDYTGTATKMFEDPSFDGEAMEEHDVEMDSQGNETKKSVRKNKKTVEERNVESVTDSKSSKSIKKKYFIDGEEVSIISHQVLQYDETGKKLKEFSYEEYLQEAMVKINEKFTDESDLREKWADMFKRFEIIQDFEDLGINIDLLTKENNNKDIVDIISEKLFNSDTVSKSEKIQLAKKSEIYTKLSIPEKEVIDMIFQKFESFGSDQLKFPDILKVEPISKLGNITEISSRFGGASNLKDRIQEIQSILLQ